MSEVQTIEEVLTYCQVHPDRETRLKCNKCGRFMCTKCAVQTPTGYRCRECVRGQQKTFNTATTADYLLNFFVLGFIGLVLSIAGALIEAMTGFGFYMIFLLLPAGYAVGRFLATLVLRLSSKRRSKNLFILATASFVLGAALPFLVVMLGLGAIMVSADANQSPSMLLMALSTIPLATIVFIVASAASLYSNLTGFNFR